MRILVVSCILSLFTAGCRPEPKQAAEPETAAMPFEGTKIVVAAPAGFQFAENWKSILDEWQEQTGATAEVREYPAEPDSAPIDTALTPCGSAASIPDANLLIFSPTEFGELAGTKRLLPLGADQQPVIDGLNWIDLYQGLRENGASIEKQPAIMPLSSPVLVCYYRRDLLNKAGLKPPQTWDDYQKLIDAIDTWAPGLKAVEPWSEHFRATMFLARAASWTKHPENFSVYFDIEKGNPLIDSPGFVRALESSLAALAKMPKDVQTYSPSDCRREILAGNAALAIAFENGPIAASGNVRKEGVQIGFVRLPGTKDVYNRSTKSWTTLRDEQVNHVPYTGFAGLCGGVSTSSSAVEAQAAWNLLSMLAIDRFDSAFAETPRSPTRKSQATRPETWSGRELTAEEPIQYVDAVSASLLNDRLIVELPVVGGRQFRKALTAGLGKVLDDSNEPQKKLEEIAAQWQAIVEKLGAAAVANSYRRVLGLPPIPSK